MEIDLFMESIRMILTCLIGGILCVVFVFIMILIGDVGHKK